MKKFVFSIMFLVSFAVSSQAGLILSIDFDPVTPGIQTTNSTPINVGGSFTANLVLQLTSPSTLNTYNYSVKFGSGLLLTNRSESSFGTLNPIDSSNTIDNINGFAYRFDGVDFNQLGGQTTPLTATIGTLTFQALGTGNRTVTPGVFDSEALLGGSDAFYASNVDISSTVQFAGGSINVSAVPEPTTLALITVASAVYCSRRSMLKRPKNC